MIEKNEFAASQGPQFDAHKETIKAAGHPGAAPLAKDAQSNAAGGAGLPAKRFCAQCGGAMEPADSFCPECGTRNR